MATKRIIQRPLPVTRIFIDSLRVSDYNSASLLEVFGKLLPKTGNKLKN